MLPLISGIYVITNTQNGKVYIGQSRSIARRWKAHKYDLVLKRHHSQHFQNSWDFYGQEAFSFEVLLELEHSDCDELFDYWEDYYIQIFRSYINTYGFNTLRTGHGCSEKAKIKSCEANKKRVWTEEAREKVRRANSARVWSEESRKKTSESVKSLPSQGKETREKKRVASTGRVQSEETRRKISEGNKGRVVSEETRRKQSEIMKGLPGRNKFQKGRKLTQETIEKMIKARTGVKRGPYKKKVNTQVCE